MSGLRQHAFILVLCAAAALLAIPAAGAAGPQHLDFGPFPTTYDDFCGTGATVYETFTARLTVWDDPNQPVDTRNHTVSDDVFVSPSTGVTVTTRSAYGFTDVLLSTEPSGVNTHQWTFKGAAQITRAGGQGVIFRDSGHFVVDTTWSGAEFHSDLLDTEVVKDAGGHPDFFGDFCAAMVPALGLG
jgi:hypothetical protein